MIGEIDVFLGAPRTWKELIDDFTQRKCCVRLDSRTLSKHFKQLEKTEKSVPISVDPSHANKVMHKVN